MARASPYRIKGEPFPGSTWNSEGAFWGSTTGRELCRGSGHQLPGNAQKTMGLSALAECPGAFPVAGGHL